jgi:uncharacterized Fe-S cluster protein YjdI
MTYIGQKMDKRYTGKFVAITYNIKRCIHAEQCVHHLTSVFKKDARPWLTVNGAVTGDRIAVQVADEPIGTVAITVESNGPYHISGDIEILNASGENTRLCRCGHNAHEPIYYGTHERIGFQAE